jgi:glycosyltransferase involved in cell wall biosynthesis
MFMGIEHKKILHINSFDQGGAANAALRLHSGLVAEQIQSTMVVRKRTRDISGLFTFPQTKKKNVWHKEGLLRFFHGSKRSDPLTEFKAGLPQHIQYFSYPFSNIDITESKFYQEADIIHLHWVAEFLDYSSFFKKNTKPVVWTLHDMEPFQGGLHYRDTANGINSSGYVQQAIIPSFVQTVIEKNILIKKDALINVKDIQVVAPSRWLMEESQKSELLGRFHHRTIPYGLDTRVFRPRDRTFSRDLLGIQKDVVCLLFVSDAVHTIRKGFIFLQEALKRLKIDNLLLLAIGKNDKGTIVTGNVKLLGRVDDERLMSAVYSAADAFIIPSIEDNLPNTVLESICCGTPVIGFPVGGIVDVIVNDFNGYVAQEVSVISLANTIEKFLDNLKRFNSDEIAKKASTDFDQSIQAKAYIKIYEKIINLS